MAVDRRGILQQVADGEITPDQAEQMLRDNESPAAPVSATDIRAIKISAGVGGIEIVGDHSVAQAEVEGPHSAEVEGDTLVIHGDWDADRGFSIHLGASGGRRKFAGRDEKRKLSRLRVRANPSLDIDAELDAGVLSIRGMRGRIRARVAAGPITLEDFTGELDVAVNAGAVRANGTLTEGESRIRSDAGAVRVALDPASSVHVIAQAALGKVVVPGSVDEPRKRFGGDRREATIGAGAATLRVETAMGSVHITTR